MYKQIIAHPDFQVDVNNEDYQLRITHFHGNHWDGEIEIPLEVIMKFVNDTVISKEKFPDYPERTLDYFDIDEFSVTIVCHIAGDEKPHYVQVANFEEAEEVWNASDFNKYL